MPQLETRLTSTTQPFSGIGLHKPQKIGALCTPMEPTNLATGAFGAIQAIKTDLIVPCYAAGSAAFFFEAHNDALVSHVSASTGAWRSALQALRSCIENTLAAVYYNDHPIELELWQSSRFMLGFSELLGYMEKHPRLSPLGVQLSGLAAMKTEYATLSKAVHASAANFR